MFCHVKKSVTLPFSFMWCPFLLPVQKESACAFTHSSMHENTPGYCNLFLSVWVISDIGDSPENWLPGEEKTFRPVLYRVFHKILFFLNFVNRNHKFFFIILWKCETWKTIFNMLKSCLQYYQKHSKDIYGQNKISECNW